MFFLNKNIICKISIFELIIKTFAVEFSNLKQIYFMKNFLVRSLSLFLIIIGISTSVMGQVPVNWTGDIGIETFKEGTIIQQGLFSCGVKVNTGTQAECDLTSSVDLVVTAGNTFKFSFWYFTSANVRVRAAIDWSDATTTYSVAYAGPTTTGTWAEFSFEGTVPAAVTTAKAHLRFYDVTPGFVAPETQYIDDVKFESPVGTAITIPNGNFETWPGILPEPTNYPTTFTATANNLSINLAWTDATGAQLPSAYLIKASIANDITLPVDGTFVSDDLDLTDGTGAANVAFGAQTFSFANLESAKTYYFKIFPYTNAGIEVDFKTGGTPPSAQATTSSLSVINAEGFDSGLGNWSQISVIGDQVWHQAVYQAKTYANMNGFSGAAIPNEDWLISPTLNFDPYDNETLNFETAMNYTGEVLHVLISSNYVSGDPNLATWDELEAELSTGGYVWAPSGAIDISDYNGNVHIAFKYLSDAASAASWEVDGIMVTGEISGTNPVIIISSPVAGAQWWQGNAYQITWNAMNTSPNVKIEVSSNASAGTPTWTQIGTALATAGTWTWNVPAGQTIGNDYKIKISDNNAATVFGLSGTFSIVAPPTLYNIVINEIMYNPPTAQGPDTDYEWMEIMNNETFPVDISGWKITTAIDYTFTAGTVLQPNGYLVIAVKPDTIINFYGITNVVGPYTGGINNTGELIELKDASLNVIDAVTYGIIAPWPPEPNGTGKSLSLLDPDLNNSLPESWVASTEDYGTPGIPNFSPDPTLIVAYPNGGEYLQQGQSYNITWQAMNYAGTVKIELLDGAAVSQILATSVNSADLSWTWNLATNQPLGSQFKIRITDTSTGTPSDESNDFFSVIPPVTIPNLVITEIMYNPPEVGTDSLEFIEIYNNDNVAVDLTDYHFSSGVEFIFPSMSMNPGDYVVVAVNPTAMQNTFGVTALPTISGGLNNTGELLELQDNFDNIVDFVTYADYTPWDSLADGYGPSLTLCDPSSDNNLPENWAHSIDFAALNAAGDSIWATPGAGCGVPAPVADFVASNTSIQTGQSITFTDLSTGTPTLWQWAFEGGSPSTFEGQNPPAITYNSAGTFDVKLTVTNEGGSDVEQKVNYITVTTTPPPPVANFVGTPLTIFVGGSVGFTDLSTNTPTSWVWTFEGGLPATSTSQNPSNIVYNTAGTFDVTLVSTNAYGSDTEIKTNYITVQVIPPPQAAFTGNPTTIFVGQSVTFTNQSTGNPTSWQWVFEGGTPATSNLQTPPAIFYNNAGVFDVSLTVSNTNGSTTETKTDYITVQGTTVLNLVITEIMYNPPDIDTDTLEYIEIYNNSTVAAELSGVYFSLGIVYTFPNYTLNPYNSVVVCKDSVAFNTAFGIEARQWTEGALSNSGETIELKDVSGNVLDVVAYDDAAPWPTSPDGTGPSLSICPWHDNSLPENWYASFRLAGYNNSGLPLYGTPGEECEYVGIPETPTAGQLSISPNPTNGNFTLSLPDETNWNIEIFGLTGKMVYSTTVSSSVNAIVAGDLPKGLYLLKATSVNNQKFISSKLIIN